MLRRVLKKNIPLIIFTCLFIIICLLTKYNFYEFIVSVDDIVREFVFDNMTNKALTALMKILTNFASAVGIVTIFVISMFLFKDKLIKILLVSNVSLIGLLSLFLKTLFSRKRPLESIIKMPSSYSFPSGHTFFAVGFLGLIVYFISQSDLNKYIKMFLIPIFILLILLIGFSRIYLGVHHFTDVIGGMIFGILILSISINTYKVLKEEKI